MQDNFAHQFNQLHELHNEPSEWLFEDEEDEEKDEDEEVAEQEAAARRQNIDLEAEQYATRSCLEDDRRALTFLSLWPPGSPR